MTSRQPAAPPPASGSRLALACLAGVMALMMIGTSATAQPHVAPRPGAQAAAEQGVRWQDLKPSQQVALSPLQHEWSGMDATRKRKWLRIASRYSKLSAEEQARLQARMTEWSDLTPQQRGRARLNFRDAKEVPSQDRQARWEAYQALPPEQRQQLAERAAASKSDPRAQRANPKAGRGDKSDRDHAKANAAGAPVIVPRPVTPTVVRASRGATTSLISRQPAPAARGETSRPRIVATPELVDSATLLPRHTPPGGPGAASPSRPAPARRP